MSGSMLSRAGVTRADLVVVLGLAPLLLLALLGARKAGDEQARRAQCAANLKQIGEALLRYASDHRHRFPRVVADPENGETVIAYSNWEAPDPFKPGGPGPNDVTAALYLLVRGDFVKPEAFVCPSTDQTPMVFEQGGAAGSENGKGKLDRGAAAGAPAVAAGRSAKGGRQGKSKRAAGASGPVAASPKDISNFPSPAHLSYSYANPYAGKGSSFELRDMLRPDFAVAADLNPGGASAGSVSEAQMPPRVMGWGTTSQPSDKPKSKKFNDVMKRANSPNHAGLGQNVVYMDGHVSFQPTPYCGSLRMKPGAASDNGPYDNIYTRHFKDGAAAPAPGDADPAMGPPGDSKDSVLLPVADAAGRAKGGGATKKSDERLKAKKGS